MMESYKDARKRDMNQRVRKPLDIGKSDGIRNTQHIRKSDGIRNPLDK